MLASIKLEDSEHLSYLEGKWMTPVPFILALKGAGLNIFPAVYSHFYVVTNNKARMSLSLMLLRLDSLREKGRTPGPST